MSANIVHVERPATILSLEMVRRAISEAKNLDELKILRDQATAFCHYAQAQKLGAEVLADVSEMKLRAERRMGEMLAVTVDHAGVAGKAGPGRGKKPLSSLPVVSGTIPDGVSQTQSSRWQKVAKVPEPVFEEYVAQAREKSRVMTTAGALQLAARRVQSTWTQPTHTPDTPRQVYRALVIDPPWPMTKSERSAEPTQGHVLNYATTSLDEIAALPIADLADPVGCHLYLWVTHRFLPDGLRLLERWGFTYHCLFTWVKPSGMTPFSWMFNSEHALFAYRGPFVLQEEALGLKVAFESPAPWGKHSTKPDAFFERVRLASPEPRLEMYARTRRDGFDAWGNEL